MRRELGWAVLWLCNTGGIGTRGGTGGLHAQSITFPIKELSRTSSRVARTNRRVPWPVPTFRCVHSPLQIHILPLKQNVTFQA